MLHILLTIILSILKIIGIILAAVIGILLLVLICGLFVPVRYRVAADGKLGGQPPVRVEIKVTWLLHIVNILFSYHESACLRIRLFCFTLLDSSRNKEGKKKEKGGKRKKQKTGKKGSGREKTGIQEIREEEKTKEEEAAGPETEKLGIAEAGESGSQTEEAEGTLPEEAGEGMAGRIKAFFHAVFRFFHKLVEALKNIEYTIREICGKIKKVMENIRYYIDILQGEAFRSVFRNAKKQLLWICRRLKPEKCRINLRAGMEDPAVTGQIMAVYGMLYPAVGGGIFLQPEFEEKVMEGDVYIKGKITGIIFLVAGLKIVLDKNIWRLLKLLKKEGV